MSGARCVGAVAGEDNSASLQVGHQVGLCFLQGTEEQVLARQVPGWSKAEELPHLVLIGGLCTNSLVLIFSQHSAVQSIQHPVNACDPGNECLPVLVHKMC